MPNYSKVQTGCSLVGEYVDEAELPANLVFHQGEAVRTHVVGDYLDYWANGDETKEFTVLLKDGRALTVLGHRLKHWPTTIPGESGSYGVVMRSAGKEVLVALFKIVEVIGIFHGEIQSERKNALQVIR